MYVSLGPEEINVTVPDVVGNYSDTAKQKILDSGLKIGDVVEVYDSAAAGVVVSQYPRAYSSAILDDVVTIYVSKGHEPTTTTVAVETEPATEAPTKAPEETKAE